MGWKLRVRKAARRDVTQSVTLCSAIPALLPRMPSKHIYKVFVSQLQDYFPTPDLQHSYMENLSPVKARRPLQASLPRTKTAMWICPVTVQTLFFTWHISEFMYCKPIHSSYRNSCIFVAHSRWMVSCETVRCFLEMLYFMSQALNRVQIGRPTVLPNISPARSLYVHYMPNSIKINQIKHD